MATAKQDLFGNPEGTVYSEAGIASHPTDKTTKLKNAPQAKEGEAPIVYNEDGTVFTIPADSDKVQGTMRADIQGLKIAVSKGEQRIATATEMLNESTDAAEKKIFEKNIATQQVAVDSNKKALAEIEGKLHEYQLSLVTPAQRANERLLSSLIAKKVDLQAQIDECMNKKKLYTPAPIGGNSGGNSDSTDEQKAALKAAILEHGTQGKAIVAMIKKGHKNAEIAKMYGISQASIPGPKNTFLRSAEGLAWIAANPDIAAKLSS